MLAHVTVETQNISDYTRKSACGSPRHSAKQFNEAARPQPSAPRYPTLKHQTTLRRDPFLGMKVKIVTMNEFKELFHRSASYVKRNLWVLLAAWFASLALGGVIAFVRRRANTRVQGNILHPSRTA